MKLFLTLTIVIAALIPGCSTSTDNPETNARNAGINAAGQQALSEAGKVLGKVAVQTLLSVVQGEATGQKADYVQSAANGLLTQVDANTVSSAFTNITNAFAAGKAQQTAKTVGTIASTALANGQSPPKVANALAAVMFTATGAPPAK